MQALYEKDMTEHGLDDIIQHLGVQERGEHGAYFARTRSDARKAVEEIGFLARNADNDALDQPNAVFDRATDDLLGRLFDAPELADGEPAETTSSPRSRAALERKLKSVLSTYRAEARAIVEPEHQGHPLLADDTAEGDLAAIQAQANRDVDEILSGEERASREVVMGVMSRTATLTRGVERYEHEIDPHIERAAPAFPIPQLASIDRAVLRIAVYELLYEPNVPFKAVINEAVDIAKGYGGPNSGRFVNGVLRTISESLPESRKSQPA